VIRDHQPLGSLRNLAVVLAETFPPWSGTSTKNNTSAPKPKEYYFFKKARNNGAAEDVGKISILTHPWSNPLKQK
jgi:hypothetical protein